MNARRKSVPPAALAALAVIATSMCTRPARYPVTGEARALSDLNARLKRTAPPVAQSVTFERLVRAREEPHNWLTYYGAYDGQRYSALAQIDASNVRDLKVAWIFQYGGVGVSAGMDTYAYEAAPIVVDGVMFVTGYDGLIWALDAATGGMLWQHHHATPIDVPLCCGNVNRGAAVARGKVFYVTPHGHLVALDATNGQVVWDAVFVDMRAGESATVAPLVVKNLVIVGSSGAEYGVRGHIDAFDIDSGRRVWRRYNVPAPGEAGFETWPADTDAWARGGGTAWITGSYDPELDLVYWGTGNPGPDFDGSVRPGDNLYTSALIAFDPDDGALRWHYQWTPHDVWDYDGVNENILFDQDGRKLLAHFDKNGYLFILDRTVGALVRATPFARATWGDIDATTGAVTVRRSPTPEGVEICPGPAGAKEWPHAAYSPRTGLLYTPVVELCATFRSGKTEFVESMPFWGSAAQPLAGDNWGGVKAFDPVTGQEVWSWRTEYPIVASTLATAGDLVFTGEPTGHFTALHARTGAVLWRFQTGSGIHSSPVTYAVSGRQHVAVLSGWGGWMKGFAPDFYGAPRGDALIVFTLP
jgi:alcohol dehydrogenase (cytochrome c)